MRDRDEILRRTEAFVRERMHGEGTGHDWWHVDRVRRTAAACGPATAPKAAPSSGSPSPPALLPQSPPSPALRRAASTPNSATTASSNSADALIPAAACPRRRTV